MRTRLHVSTADAPNGNPARPRPNAPTFRAPERLQNFSKNGVDAAVPQETPGEPPPSPNLPEAELFHWKNERHRLLEKCRVLEFNSRPSHESPEKNEDEPANRPIPDQNPRAVAGAVIDAVESALAEAIKGATSAGEWATVAALAKELEARRLARAANVVEIDAARSQRRG
jgi:hypothetical protein